MIIVALTIVGLGIAGFGVWSTIYFALHKSSTIEKKHKAVKKGFIYTSVITISLLLVVALLPKLKTKIVSIFKSPAVTQILTDSLKQEIKLQKRPAKTLSDTVYNNIPIQLGKIDSVSKINSNEPNSFEKADLEKRSSQKFSIFVNVGLDRSGADVLVDNILVNSAPCTVYVSGGFHQLIVRYDYQFNRVLEYSKTISVVRDMTIHISNREFKLKRKD